ncbi:MAG: helix-turn-helix domain-containing protein [Candidatus Methylomirabilales bacterium]
MKEIITASQVATLLQMHINTVYRFAEAGLIPGTKIGHNCRFRRKKVLELVRAQKRRTKGRNQTDRIRD